MRFYVYSVFDVFISMFSHVLWVSSNVTWWYNKSRHSMAYAIVWSWLQTM